MVLQENPLGTRGMQHNFVHALPEFRIPLRHERDAHPPVTRPPPTSCILGAINTSGRYRNVHALCIRRMRKDGMQAKSAVARTPARPMRMIKEARHQRPGFSIVARFKYRRRLDATVKRIWLL